MSPEDRKYLESWWHECPPGSLVTRASLAWFALLAVIAVIVVALVAGGHLPDGWLCGETREVCEARS